MKEAGRGVDYEELMLLLGHSSLAVTQIYSQTLLEDPEDEGGDAAAMELMPKGNRRRRKKEPPAEQGRLL
jgi:integrase